MRVVTTIAMSVAAIGVFSTVTLVVFVIEHILAIALLVAVVFTAVALSRRSRAATCRRSLARRPATSGVIAPRGPVSAPVPQWGAAGMSSAAVLRTARRGLPQSDGWSGR